MGRPVGVSGRKKLVYLTKTFQRRQESWGGGGGTVRVTFSSTRNINQSSSPTWRRGPRTQGPAVPRHICGGMYAPRGASVPGASVPGRGRGGRSFSAPSRIGLSPSAPPRGPEERRGEPHVPRTRSFGTGVPRQSHVAAEPPPTSHDSPPTCSRRNSGCERGAPPTWAPQSQTTCRVTRPSSGKEKKKSASARRVAGRQRAARCASPGASNARTRLPVPSGRGSSRPGVSRQP